MKKASTVLGVFCLGVMMRPLFDGPPQAAAVSAGGGAQKCAAQNGDVNADGAVDLSDAVTILGNLFLGSPPKLVPLCAQSTAGSALPDSGQTDCYGAPQGEWIKQPCDVTIFGGQDGVYPTGCPAEGRFTDNGDGTVTDHCTGLMWQKDMADWDEDGQLRTDGSDSPFWWDALLYCERLSLAGHADWRLPNVRELQSIADYGRYESATDRAFGFSRACWSSTSYVNSLGEAWFVNLVSGAVDANAKTGHFYIRAVRTTP
jgi:hypothetical protein